MIIPDEYFTTVIVFVIISLVTFVLLILEEKIRTRRTPEQYHKKQSRPFWKQLLISIITGSIGSITYYFFFREKTNIVIEEEVVSITPEVEIKQEVSDTVNEIVENLEIPEVQDITGLENLNNSEIPENYTPSTRKNRRYQRGFLQG